MKRVISTKTLVSLFLQVVSLHSRETDTLCLLVVTIDFQDKASSQGSYNKRTQAPRALGIDIQSNMACLFMIWRQIPVSVLNKMFWRVALLFRGDLTSTTISLKGQEFKWYVIYKKKKESTACQTSRNVCGIVLLLLSYMWLKRTGCFLRTFTRGAGL